MASHRSKSLYAIKECSTCGRLYTKECCSIGSLEDKILVPVPDFSPRCARCGTPVDGPSCRGCAILRKKFDEDLLAYYVENGIFKYFQDTSESSDDNTNIVNALREPCVARRLMRNMRRDCEIRIRKLKQDFNVWGSEVRKKEKAYEEEKYVAACHYMLSVTCDDDDDFIPLAITPDLPIEESENSLIMGDEPLSTIPATESDEIDPILEEFADELAHIAPFHGNCLEEVNDVDQKEKEFDLEDILQIQDIILREKLLNVYRLISNIESLKNNPIPIMDSDSSETSLSFSDNSLPEFEAFSDHTEETRSGKDDSSLVPSVHSAISHLSRRFLLYLASHQSEDLIFDPGIITFHFLKPLAFLWKFLSSIFALSKGHGNKFGRIRASSLRTL
ncbi:hypothetical protein Tco_1217178 [Tanacetum coccineum]